jgi:hypothetical protein
MIPNEKVQTNKQTNKPTAAVTAPTVLSAQMAVLFLQAFLAAVHIVS